MCFQLLFTSESEVSIHSVLWAGYEGNYFWQNQFKWSKTDINQSPASSTEAGKKKQKGAWHVVSFDICETLRFIEIPWAWLWFPIQAFDAGQI